MQLRFTLSVAQGMVASGLDSPHLLENIKSLKSTVCWLKEENQSYKSKEMKVCVLVLYTLVCDTQILCIVCNI